MTFIRPTKAKLISRAQSDIETRLPGADARLRESVEAVLARSTSGGVHGLHGHQVYLSKQIIVDTAENEFLVRHADIQNMRKIAAVEADGPLVITGVNTTICPQDTLWQTADGEVYVQDADVTISGGTATPDVTAQDAGADGNQVVGTTLSLVSPVTGIDTDGTVDTGGLTGGLDEETDDALLVRYLSKVRTPPKGGGPGDYVNWALEVAGVTRAWQYPNIDGYGTVGLRFVMDNKVGTIIPSAGEVQTVQDYIGGTAPDYDDGTAPVTVGFTAYAPVAAATAFTISITPDTAAIRLAVAAELDDLYLREAKPGVTMLWSQMNEAISIAAGETDHTLSVPAADVTHTANQMPTRGAIAGW